MSGTPLRLAQAAAPQGAPPAFTPFGAGTAAPAPGAPPASGFDLPPPPDLSGAGDPLAELRDIRLPDPVSFWPPAPGWWMLAGFVLLLLVIAAAMEWRRRQTLAYRVSRDWRAMARDTSRFPDTRALAAEGALLMRRILVSTPGAPEAARLTGQAWQDFLTGGKSGLPADIGAFLALAPYLPPGAAPPPGIEREALATAVARWIRGHA